MAPTKLLIGTWQECKRRTCSINGTSCYVTTPDIALLELICEEEHPKTVKDLYSN